MTKEEADKIPLGTIVVGNFNSKWENPEEGWITSLVNHDRSETPNINIFHDGSNPYFHKSGCLAYGRFKPVRLATAVERAWLADCISAGEMVPKRVSEIINQYEIY